MTTQTRTERRQAFIREITGIVVGVLIALGLGAIATSIGWRRTNALSAVSMRWPPCWMAPPLLAP